MKKNITTLEDIYINDIQVCEGRRHVDEATVAALTASMVEIGLKVPISVRLIVIELDDGDNEGTYQLIAGAHRLAAAKQLGWDFIAAFVSRDESDDQVKLWEIAENLHRAELTVLERSEHITEWVLLTDKVGQSAHPSGGIQPADKGISKASKELGIERTEVRRSTKIAGL